MVRSVSARLALRFVGLTAALLAGFSASLYLWVQDGLERDLDQQLAVQSRMFQERFVEEYAEVRRGVHAALNPEIARFLEASGASAEVRGPDGAVFFASPGFPGASSRYLSTRIDASPEESFMLRLGLPEDAAMAPLRNLRIYFAVFLPIVLAVTWILGTGFVRRALAPVEAIRRQAERISRANVSERVPEPKWTGEFLDLARTFNEMLERLERAFQDLQNLASDAAHELRTPLATLRAEIETAIQQERSPEEYEQILASLGEEVARMSRIVSDLLMLARLDMRQHALQKERVRILPLLEEVKETWESAAADRSVTLEMRGADSMVAADPVALRRVFMNLVENAVKYNRTGGKVTLSLGRENGAVRVSISDTGIGIPAEHLPQLFRRFYRVDPGRDRSVGGAGLGLAICKSFIEAHGGTIAVESAADQGTTFTVELPALD